jgi:hypothetical protein
MKRFLGSVFVHFAIHILSSLAFAVIFGEPVLFFLGLFGTSFYINSNLLGGALPPEISILLLPMFLFVLGFLSLRSQKAFFLALAVNLVNIVLSLMCAMHDAHNGLLR